MTPGGDDAEETDAMTPPTVVTTKFLTPSMDGARVLFPGDETVATQSRGDRRIPSSRVADSMTVV